MAGHSISDYIADYLTRHGYSATVEALARDTGVDSFAKPPELLETVLAKTGLLEEAIDRTNSAFPTPQDKRSVAGTHVRSFGSLAVHCDAGVLFVDGIPLRVLAVLTADRCIHLQYGAGLASLCSPIDRTVVARVVRVVPFTPYLVAGGMDGECTVYMVTRLAGVFGVQAVGRHKLHARLIVDMQVLQHEGSLHLVSCGWDRRVCTWLLAVVDGAAQFSARGAAEVATVPTALAYTVLSKHDGVPGVRVVCVAKSELLVVEVFTDTHEVALAWRVLLNDAEYRTEGFAPSLLTVAQPANSPTLVCCGTNHEPYMRAVVVSLAHMGDAAGVARGEIMASYNTMCPQNKFSGGMVWAGGDGSEAWCVGDDGVVRVVELASGVVREGVAGEVGRVKSAAAWETEEGVVGAVTVGYDLVLWQRA